MQTEVFVGKQISQKAAAVRVLRAGCSSHCTEREIPSHSEIAKPHFKTVRVERGENKLSENQKVVSHCQHKFIKNIDNFRMDYWMILT